MEQLKGIKKELGMESDGKDKLIERLKRELLLQSRKGLVEESRPKFVLPFVFVCETFSFLSDKGFSLSLTLSCCARSILL